MYVPGSYFASLPGSFALVLQQCRVQKLARFPEKKNTHTHTVLYTKQHVLKQIGRGTGSGVSSKERLA